jgi:hypothetical protein
VKTRIPAITRHSRRLRKGAGLAIVVTGAGILVQGTLLKAALPLAVTTAISVAAALAVAMLLAFGAAWLMSAVRPAAAAEPVRIALPAPRPWR